MNIDSAAFNLPATVKAFKGKLKRNDFQRELIHTGLIKKSEIAFERLDKHNDRPKTNAAFRVIRHPLFFTVRAGFIDFSPQMWYIQGN